MGTMIATPSLLEVEKDPKPRDGGRPASSGAAPEARCLLVALGTYAPALAGALAELDILTCSCDTLGEALRELRRHDPDLVLVGGRLPEGYSRGLPVLASKAAGATLLYLADGSDLDVALDAVAAGAHDVVLPPHTVPSILLRSRIARGRSAPFPVPPSRVWVGSVEIDLNARRIHAGKRSVNLSRREFELLARLLEDRGRVVTRETLLQDIWGMDQEGEAVLEATVHRLRRKVEARGSAPRILTTVRGIGYRLEWPAQGLAAD